MVKDCLDIDPRPPVTRRIMIPLKHSRSGTRSRWHPRGGTGWWRQERLDRLPDDIHDFGLECTHDDGEVLPQVVGVGVHPA